jgi:hypothetical protein
MTHSERIAVRLSGRDHDSIDKIAAAITQPHRSPPTLSEVIRASLSVAAETLTTGGTFR